MSFVSNLLFIALLLQLSQCANITVQPVSINTTLNSTVVFSCEAVADELSFRVNNLPDTNTDVAAKGFTVTTSSNGTIRAELQAKAYEYNNNTNIRCRASTDVPPEVVFSNTSILMIQGLLDSVVDLDYTFINGSSILLTWTAPYTLDNVPITGYYIVNGLTNFTTTNNNGSITLSCTLNSISVSPINDAGIGLSNNISFYYERVSLITPPATVVPVTINGQLILFININVSTICTEEYPNSIIVSILNTDDTTIISTSIIPHVDDQMMITGATTVPNNLNTFIVNISLSNNQGTFNGMSSFTFGFLGPVTNIDSSIDNCSTIDITWTAPTVDDRVSIQYYMLRIYDAITGSLVDAVSVYDTRYQFIDNNLFIHRYTYVISGGNELGEGISNNDTFSYQRVPRSVSRAHLYIKTFNETSAIASFSIPVIIECTGESPENATVTIQCNGTGVVFTSTELVEYSQPRNITGSVSILPNQQCNISIIFSNRVGSSEPFILAFDTFLLIDPTPSPTGTDESVTSSSVIIIPVIIATILGCIVVLLLCLIPVVELFVIHRSVKNYNKRKNKETSAVNKKSEKS